MKVKQRPEDFRVEEENRVRPGPEGPFSLYRLEKAGIGTPEALRVVARAWRLGPRALEFAGLKDRHGLTGQVVSVRDGPRRNFAGRGFKLNYLGRSERPAGRGTIVCNRFRIVVRGLREAEAASFAARARQAAAGFCNYYDDQRFGSARGTRGAFVARALLRGDDEDALRLAIASPARADRSRVKRRRTLLRAQWGAWAELGSRLEDSLERRLCERLARGASFREAYDGLDRTLRSLHLAAYQAHLFNACLRRLVGPGPSHPGVAGPYVFPSDPARRPDGRIPLASAGAPAHPLLDAVLADEGVDRAMLDRFPFRGGSRDVVVVPADLAVEDPAADGLNPGRSCVVLAFALPPGAYATMLLKRSAARTDADPRV